MIYFYLFLDKPADNERYETIKFQFNVNESYIKMFHLEAIQKMLDILTSNTQTGDMMSKRDSTFIKEYGHILIDRHILKTKECVVVFGVPKNELPVIATTCDTAAISVFDYIKLYIKRERTNEYY